MLTKGALLREWGVRRWLILYRYIVERSADIIVLISPPTTVANCCIFGLGFVFTHQERRSLPNVFVIFVFSCFST